ncbi:high affinity copper uptake protein 1 isoform X2 [Chironomus tepperi]|uniref:high affinity copper uptake protein 1 isoform X2 n=1 Tax=Chironomus tepperi TaxID=113505 RepID=UPI00391F87C7
MDDHSHHMHHNHHSSMDSATTEIPHDHDHSMHSDHNMMDPVDNSMHSGHAMMSHMMSMAFHGGCNETILFTQWTISSTSGLFFSMVAIFALAIFYEGLKFYRERLFWKVYNNLQYRAVTENKNGTNGEAGDSRVVQPTMFSLDHLLQSFLHLIQVTISLMLMLIFMTYNTWLCLSVVFGAMVGYLLFGWKKSIVVDVTEHCH